MLKQESLNLVKATAPVLAERGEELTRHFYRRMFSGNPEVKAYFNPAHQHRGTQQRALAGAICAFAANVDNLAVLGPAVELIAQKHASLRIVPEQYPIVGKHLLGSIREVLGEAATDEIVDAWAEAYQLLADILIGREAEIYEEHRERFGWVGFKEFVVERRVDESDRITSFYLKPADGSDLGEYLPGQYITVRVPGPEGGTTMRNYSLSEAPGRDFFRISVKREAPETEGGPAGWVSNYLHDRVAEGDRVEVGPPCGEFTLDVEAARGEERPLVFLSGGVGITPVLAMFRAAIEAGLERDLYFFHGAIDGSAHAFNQEVRELAERHGRTRTFFCYSEPTEEDVACGRCDRRGFITMNLLKEMLPELDCDYYICGPKPFMLSLYGPLLAADVPESQVRVEFFGPKQELAPEPIEAQAR